VGKVGYNDIIGCGHQNQRNVGRPSVYCGREQAGFVMDVTIRSEVPQV